MEYIGLFSRGTNPEADEAKIAKLRKDAGLDAKIVVRQRQRPLSRERDPHV